MFIATVSLLCHDLAVSLKQVAIVAQSPALYEATTFFIKSTSGPSLTQLDAVAAQLEHCNTLAQQAQHAEQLAQAEGVLAHPRRRHRAAAGRCEERRAAHPLRGAPGSRAGDPARAPGPHPT